MDGKNKYSKAYFGSYLFGFFFGAGIGFLNGAIIWEHDPNTVTLIIWILLTLVCGQLLGKEFTRGL